VKKYKMETSAIKELMYGGVRELMNNRTYYYHSSVGQQYSHWTDEGQQALAEYMNIVGYKMLEIEEVSLNKRAKELVLKGLKGDKV
jgi:hypothetical protein